MCLGRISTCSVVGDDRRGTTLSKPGGAHRGHKDLEGHLWLKHLLYKVGGCQYVNNANACCVQDFSGMAHTRFARTTGQGPHALLL